MHPGGRSSSRARAAALLAIALLAATVLAGCSAAAAPSATPTPTPTETFGATLRIPVTAEETCAQIIDVNTLVFNARVALDTGRIAQQEFDGIARLAARMVHRIDTTGDSALTEATATLAEVVGAYRTGGAMTAVDVESAEWQAALDAAKDECTREGVEFYVESWTGG
jgi:PBP1b-binding outer membrane lipoprotein LpoB